MKLVKEKFVKTEFGGQMVEIVKAIDFYLEEKSHTNQWEEPEKYKRLRKILIAHLHNLRSSSWQ